MNLLEQLASVYPDWREYHDTPIEAAVEVGLLDEADLAVAEVPEVDLHDTAAAWHRLCDDEGEND